MADVIQGAIQSQPFVFQWYAWGAIVGFVVSLALTGWLVFDARRSDKDVTSWTPLMIGAILLGLPALVARVSGGVAFELRDSLPLMAYLGMGGLLFVLLASFIHAADVPLGDGRDDLEDGSPVRRFGTRTAAATLFGLTIGLVLLFNAQSHNAAGAVRAVAAENAVPNETPAPVGEPRALADIGRDAGEIALPTASVDAIAAVAAPEATTSTTEQAVSEDDAPPQAADPPTEVAAPLATVGAAAPAAVRTIPTPTPRPAAAAPVARAARAPATSPPATLPPNDLIGPPVPAGVVLPTPVIVLMPLEGPTALPGIQPAPAVSPGPRLEFDAEQLGLQAMAPTPGSSLDQALGTAGMAEDRFRSSLASGIGLIGATPVSANRPSATPTSSSAGG